MDSHELNVQTMASAIHTESVGILSHTVAIAYQNGLQEPDSKLKQELDALLEKAKEKLQSYIDNAVLQGIFDEVWAIVTGIANAVYWAIESFLKTIGINI